MPVYPRRTNHPPSRERPERTRTGDSLGTLALRARVDSLTFPRRCDKKGNKQVLELRSGVNEAPQSPPPRRATEAVPLDANAALVFAEAVGYVLEQPSGFAYEQPLVSEESARPPLGKSAQRSKRRDGAERAQGELIAVRLVLSNGRFMNGVEGTAVEWRSTTRRFIPRLLRHKTLFIEAPESNVAHRNLYGAPGPQGKPIRLFTSFFNRSRR